MREENRQKRQREIETAAYRLIGEKGYDGMSMLAVAKAARASNETLYNWYGDKAGLFRAMVSNNAADIQRQLSAVKPDDDPLVELSAIAPRLLAMLTGERAIALNRAAAADPSGELGRLLAENGRSVIMPLIGNLVAAAADQGRLGSVSPGQAVEWFLSLLVGDLQVRRVTGAIGELTPEEITQRSEKALGAFHFLVRAGAN